RIAARRGLGIAKHDPDLHADLIDEDHGALGLADDPRKLAERLAHEARLQPHVRIPHHAFDLRFWHQCCDRVDDDEVNRTGTHQYFTDFQRLFAGVRL